jgi:tRNA(adenine34) deaminase
MTIDDRFMDRALELATIAYNLGEVPVGAIVVVDGEIVGEGYNQRELKTSSLAHAEIFAIHNASRILGRWRLYDATVYSTLEPCLMCAGALSHARVKNLVYGVADPKFGAIDSLYQVADDERLNHRFGHVSGVRSEQCAELLKQFFKNLRTSRP